LHPGASALEELRATTNPWYGLHLGIMAPRAEAAQVTKEQ
jgi:hypothetical protein